MSIAKKMLAGEVQTIFPKTWSFYKKEDGTLLSQTFSGAEAVMRMNIPEGCEPIEGIHSHLRSQVDLLTGNVIERKAPLPSTAEVFWAKMNSLEGKAGQVRDVIAAKMRQVEEAQHRPAREMLLGDKEARAKSGEVLARLDARMKELRHLLQLVNAAATIDALPSMDDVLNL